MVTAWLGSITSKILSVTNRYPGPCDLMSLCFFLALFHPGAPPPPPPHPQTFSRPINLHLLFVLYVDDAMEV